MPLALEFEGVGKCPIRRCDFEPGNRRFVVTAGDNDQLRCFVSYPFAAEPQSVAEAMVMLLFNPRHAEAEVKSVQISEIGKNTVGWICTLSALTSEAHTFSRSPYFRMAAFAATAFLLLDDFPTKQVMIANEGTVQLGDLFDESISLLILHRPSLKNTIDYHGLDLLPSLYQNGFVVYRQDTLGWKSGAAASQFFASNSKIVKLRILQRFSDSDDFIRRVFRDLLPSAVDSLLRFFLLYQVVEVLLACVFAHRQSENIATMVPIKNNPFLVHDKIEKLIADSSEKARIQLLFGEYTGLQHQLDDLKSAGNDVFRMLKLEEFDDTARVLYGVRNLLFHNLRGVDQVAHPLLEKVVEELEWAVPELLLKFRWPALAK